MSGPAKPKLADPGALIRAGKHRTDEYRVCTDPDLVAEYEQLVTRRAEEKAAAADSLAGGSVAELDAEIADLLARMEAATVPLVFRSLPRPKWRAYVDEHPPRKDAEGKLSHPGMDTLGVNFESFFDATIRASLVSPELDAETFTILLEELLSDQQYLELTDVVWKLNKTTVSVPFSSAVSPRTQNSSGK